MDKIQYAGENLLPGKLGELFIILAIIAGLISLYYYIKSIQGGVTANLSARNKGRIFYYIQTGLVLIIGGILFSLILGHNFEYSYVYKHSSVLMPGKYIISSFWAGQEGSFLLWAMLISVFGIIALYNSRKLEASVMAVTSVSIIFMMTMILGVNFLGMKFGSNPFELLREAQANQGMDFFKNPNYLSFIQDGNGLNPLLENPWMVIHPPILFMGYATALFPFAFALGSLIQNDKKYWIKLTLPWVLVSLGLLGAGLILGGAWAYQSLTFGGFWAWDPVENASLVPWLVLVAALHFMLLSYKRDKYYRSTYIFSFLGFLMVIYASYLTRSGVLGETSVHAFGDNGLTFQLISFMVVFTIAPVWMMVKRRKELIVNDLPNLFNRDFMMLYGSVIILLSAFQIISTTSLPVFSKIFNTNLALGSDVTGFYNDWQLPFAMLTALLLGIVHYLNYEKNDLKTFYKNIAYPFGLALIIAIAGYYADGDMLFVHALFLFLIVFAVLSSIAYLFKFISNHRNLAAALTHLGFTLFLLGVLITFSNTITYRSTAGGVDQGSNIMLFKNQVKQVGDRYMVYKDSKEERDEIFYQIDFLKKNDKDEMIYQYSVFPSVKYNEMMGNVHNPDTRNLLKGDIFMYLTFAEDRAKRAPDGFSASQTMDVSVKDTIRVENKPVILDSIEVEVLDPQQQNINITAQFRTTDSLNNPVTVPLLYSLKGNIAESGIASIPGTQSGLRFDHVGDVVRTIKVSVLEKQPEFIVLKVMFFPWIMVLWLGAIVMFAGFTVAIYKRAIRVREV